MNMLLSSLHIATSHKGGRGVFTTKAIPANTVIEISPVLVFSVKEKPFIEQTHLANYVFEWGYSRRYRALGMGYVSMYNHDYSSNCDYEMDFEEKTITVKTVKDVPKGGELYINYNADPEEKKPLWFDAI